MNNKGIQGMYGYTIKQAEYRGRLGLGSNKKKFITRTKAKSSDNQGDWLFFVILATTSFQPGFFFKTKNIYQQLIHSL